MNYEKLYYAIINKALRKQITGQRWKGDGTYYESHHIKPRSLGGLDDERNLVLLTAKEHYLCHWLLVKRYSIGTYERGKMVKAWFMMAAVGDTKRPKFNMRNYEKYRIEFCKEMSKMQTGLKNSQYGTHWYTSIDTGESKKFKVDPGSRYIRGKNMFHGQYMVLPYFRYECVSKTLKQLYKNDLFLFNTKRGRKKKVYGEHVVTCYNINDLSAKKFKIEEIPENYRRTKTECKLFQNMCFARKLWDEFHNGNYKSLNEFSKTLTISQPALTCKLKKYIPLYSKVFKKRFDGCSNKELVGKYE